MTAQAFRRRIAPRAMQSESTGTSTNASWLPALALLLTGFFVAIPARADVHLRVEARPITAPIEALVTVTDASGAPIGGLAVGDFIIKLDGVPLLIPPADFTLPPSQDPNQKVAVIFAMDYSTSVTKSSLTAMQDAVNTFIDALHVGDYAALVKFNDTNPAKASVVWPFTQIDQGPGNQALKASVMDAYPGSGTNLLDAISVSMDQFMAPASPLPNGPKAIIVFTDGGENASTTTASDAVATANDNSIPIFTIGVGDISVQKRLDLLIQLASETGGEFVPAPGNAEIAEAYARISFLLTNEYLVTIPADAVTDCAQHTLRVAVTGQATPAVVSFGRCDTTPDPFDFQNKRNVTPNTMVTSSPITITGINGPSQIGVIGGEYSIGCKSSSFRPTDSLISNGDTVCVRHAASLMFSTETITTLTVGGISGAFKSTTMDEPPPGSGGGGGATGAAELLLGLVALIARRRVRS